MKHSSLSKNCQIQEFSQIDLYETELPNYAASLSLIEIGLGSLLHSLRVPGTGHWLSLNQIFFMARATKKMNDLSAPFRISTIVAILKSLSPVGKKITPMLAITMQGFLFNVGIMAGAGSFIGFVVGAILSGIWAIIQPLLILSFLWAENTKSIIQVLRIEIEKFLPNTTQYIIPIFLFLVSVKVLLSIAICITSLLISDRLVKKYQDPLLKRGLDIKINNPKPRKSKQIEESAAIASLRDLKSPLVILGIILNAIFLVLMPTSNYTALIWNLLRPLAMAYILFYLLRIFPISRLAKLFDQWGYKKQAHMLQKTIEILFKNQSQRLK